jgi:hypothetical protein
MARNAPAGGAPWHRRFARIGGIQPRGTPTWAADGQWYWVPRDFHQYRGLSDQGWSGELRRTTEADWVRYGASSGDPYYDYWPYKVTDLRGRTQTFVMPPWKTLADLAFAHYITRSRRTKLQMGGFTADRITFVKRDGTPAPMRGFPETLQSWAWTPLSADEAFQDLTVALVPPEPEDVVHGATDEESSPSPDPPGRFMATPLGPRRSRTRTPPRLRAVD